eukprot:scaffold977_cov128-Cylindrotheca_fusiformis.AAC.4
MTGDNESSPENTSCSTASEDKGHSFRKRKLSLTNIRHGEHAKRTSSSSPGQNEIVDPQPFLVKKELMADTQHRMKNVPEDERAHSFRKRRLSLTQNREDSSQEDCKAPHRHRRLSDASGSSLESSGVSASGLQGSGKRQPLKSRIAHAPELLSQPPPSPMPSSDTRLYEQSARLPQRLVLEAGGDRASPKWKKRHTRQLHEDERELPFPRDVVGTFSCHGIEPIYEDENSREEDDDGRDKPTTAAKINQDRGGIAFPYGNCGRTALFAVYDGHGQGGELVSQFALHEVQRRLEKHPNFTDNIEKAFQETFLAVDESLKGEVLIEPLYAGTTACVALLRENKLVLANAGDSRAVLAKRVDNKFKALDLTEDQNPDLPEEQARIERMGGYVSPPPEPGLSARVWLDVECTQIGLAMARSLGDHAVKPIGVIANPVVTFHDIEPEDEFVIFATDGVWEFISSDEAIQIVAKNLKRGSTKACQALIEIAAGKWHDEEGKSLDAKDALRIRVISCCWDSFDVTISTFGHQAAPARGIWRGHRVLMPRSLALLKMGFVLPQRRWVSCGSTGQFALDLRPSFRKKGMQCLFSIASSRSAGHVPEREIL